MKNKYPDTDANVVNLSQFRDKKFAAEDVARGRTPLYVSHLNGQISGSPHYNKPAGSEEFGDRMHRIKSSLEKINFLMNELKKNSSSESQSKPKGDRRS